MRERGDTRLLVGGVVARSLPPPGQGRPRAAGEKARRSGASDDAGGVASEVALEHL
jgi:hypothetical protein